MANAPVQTINMRFVSRTELPVIGRGLVATKASVTILGNGQISFSTVASKALSVPSIAISFNEKSREVYVIGATPINVKKYKLQQDLLFPLKTSKKGNTYAFAGSSLLQSKEVFGGDRYDYKASGNQVFEASDNEKDNIVIFNLPKGRLEKRVVAPRKPRTKKVKDEEGNTTTTNGVNGAMLNQSALPEDALQLAD